MSNEWEVSEGARYPLGVTWILSEKSYNFALYSRHAEAVTLLLYNDQDFVTPCCAIPFKFPSNKTNRVWHRRVSLLEAKGARYYAYRISGPFQPETGQLYDDEKILLDPYAKGVYFPPSHSRAAACVPGSNAGQAPLGMSPPHNVVETSRQPKPRHDYDLIIYEMHVRGFTRRENSNVSEQMRGTFSGVIQKIPYLQELGITAVELLPIHQFDPQEGNYWGYMTLNYFSPHLAYGSEGTADTALSEFRSMVEAFHAAGIEVFLDVVYNHTTEMGFGGPTYSFRGIDNSTYYDLSPGDLSVYINHSRCGNDLRTTHPMVRRLVVDSLRYWASESNVDGFRFDLASIFTFNKDGKPNLDDPAIISEITNDPILADVRLIAEPWAGDTSSYEMGRAFPGKTWRQWNDHFRNTVRGFVKGDENLVADLMTRLYGSTDLFPDNIRDACRPYQSVNYVDSHDGLNLCDLVSYTNDSERSWNCGYEGDNGTPAEVLQLRRQQVKNIFCLLMLSNGTPMFVAGDEFMNTQLGNNNPYNQDNEITWLDWSLTNTNSEILRFFKNMIAFRKSHPSIGRSTGWGSDVSWHGTDIEPDLAETSHSLAYWLRGMSVGDSDIYVMINAYWSTLAFNIQSEGLWHRVIDTSLVSPEDILDGNSGGQEVGQVYNVSPRSIVVLIKS